MSNNTYNTLKWIALIAMPLIATAVSVIGKIWGWEIAPQISATITALATCVGGMLVKSSADYHKEIVVNGDEDDEE